MAQLLPLGLKGCNEIPNAPIRERQARKSRLSFYSAGNPVCFSHPGAVIIWP